MSIAFSHKLLIPPTRRKVKDQYAGQLKVKVYEVLEKQICQLEAFITRSTASCMYEGFVSNQS